MNASEKSESLPLYNSRIINNYIKLLEKKYPEVDIQNLLSSAGMEQYEVDDPGHWFTQENINRFHARLTQLTANPNISREAGRFSASPEFMGHIRQYLLSQATPDQAYAAIGRSSAKVTRSTDFTSRKLSSHSVEIIVKPKEGIREKPFQCENRMGMLEAVTLTASNKLPKIDHPECVFQNGKVCRYIISWEKTKSFILKKIRNLSAVLSLFGCLIGFFVNPMFTLSTVVPILISIVLIIALVVELLEKRELTSSLNETFNSTDKLIDQIDENYNNALLIHEFGLAISRQTNIDDILTNVVQILENRLDYDRGIILLENQNKTRLVFRAGFGYEEDQLEYLLEKTWFSLDKPESKGVFVVSYREQKPFLINNINIDSIKGDMTSRSLEVLKLLGTQSFICCPIICDGMSIGILAVDNLKSKRPLVQSDISLLQGFAPLIGASIRNEEQKKTLETQLQVAQKMESIGTLAGGIAHDFNNLLMGIQGRTSILQMDKDPSHQDFEHLRGIEEYVKSAASLTKQLLGFARGGKYDVTPTNLNELIQNQNRLFGRTRKEIKISGKYDATLWVTEVDQGQIEQVLMNLYVNAWQAMPDGGDIYVQTENVTIGDEYKEIYNALPGRYVKISVTDTGIGIDEKTQQRIFDPFFTTKEMGRGTGLGLASVYGIIKNHHGFINVYSELNEGTTFNIYLPVSNKEAAIKEEKSSAIFKGSETVLLVDDEEVITDVAKIMLEKLGYEAIIATSGKKALEMYQSKKDDIDIVILDMIMPDMGGGMTFDLLKEINPNVKVLLSSGYSIDGQASKIMQRGCCGFIQKPFTSNELSIKLRENLD